MSNDGHHLGPRRSRIQGGWSQSHVTHPKPQSSPSNVVSKPNTTNPVSQSSRHLNAWSSMKVDSSLEQRNTNAVVYQEQAATSMASIMPQNFSWVVKDKVCAMAFPGQPENLQYLLDNNVGCLISLTPERLPPVSSFPELKSALIMIEDFTAPTIEQVNKCLDVMENTTKDGKAVAIHCRMGKGRTGTMLACYFVKFHDMDAQQAISTVKRFRHGSSCQTREQHNTVFKFERHLRKVPHDSHD